MMRHILTTIILIATVALLNPGDLYAEEKHNFYGIVWNTELAGVEAEYRTYEYFGIRGVAVYAPGLGLEKNEYIYNLAAVGVLHPAGTKSRIDPQLLFGTDYSFHHWELSTSGKSGTIHDVTVGGGAGIAVAYSNSLRVALTLWVNYDYKIKVSTDEKSKGDRFFLLLPTLEFCHLF